MEQIVPLVEEFVLQDHEEYAKVKSERRAGRPASTREDVLRIKIAKNEKEYENGFCEYTIEPENSRQTLTVARHARPHSY